MSVVVVNSYDGWQGLYKDGKLVVQDHQISLTDLATALGFEVKWVDGEWLYTQGRLPELLDEVVLENTD